MDALESKQPQTALEINLERTRAVVDIPSKHRILMDIVRNHYGVAKRTEELLVELQHYEPARSRLSCQVDFTPALDGLRLTVAPDE